MAIIGCEGDGGGLGRVPLGLRFKRGVATGTGLQRGQLTPRPPLKPSPAITCTVWARLAQR